ncbi:TPR-like protein [Ceratobasidium sp. AG-I]|nr:TPR-like protein [Ceratobasidium sp. AG-I]
MATRRVLSAAEDIAPQLLRLTATSTDVLPLLKSTARGALHIAEIVKKFRSNKAEWQEFQDYVKNATASIIYSLAQTDPSQTDLRDKLDTLQRTMGDIRASVEVERDRPPYVRFFKFGQDSDVIADMRKKLEEAVRLFTLSSIITTEINVEKTMDALVTNSKILSGIAQDAAATAANTVSISDKTPRIALNATLQKLHYVQGASWDPCRMCLPKTRINIINDVFAWVDGAGGADGAQIYLLTAVAGAGKTTVAHTVAHHFHERGQLVSSFFFDRETEGRNTPIALFTTIAADLARVSGQLADRITAAIENEQGLPLAPLSRQFQELVLKPCQDCTVSRPLVIVIDGLDEGFNNDLLKVLRDDVPRLLSTFRIFLTSRMQPDIDSLRRQSHVRLAPLNIDSSANLADTGIFVRRRLQQVAEARGFDSDWPGEQLRTEFEARAAGLFIWVATVCDYILSQTDPRRELEKILSEFRLNTTSAETKMDRLYARILESCNWEDKSFVHGYHRAMGTSLATKTPLTISAWNVLFNDKAAVPGLVLQRLGPLLTGMSKDHHRTQPVRAVHQSLRDFLGVRAGSLPEYAKLQVDEQKHSQDLALLCLRLLNRGLREGIVGVGYLVKDPSKFPGIPSIKDGEVPEALWYACRFWIDHVLDVKPAASAELQDALQSFMKTKARPWMEIMTAGGQFRGLSGVREWVQNTKTTLGPDAVERFQQSNEAHANAFYHISLRLKHEGRRAEALAASQESTTLYRRLARDDPAKFTQNLALALNDLSVHHCALGYREDALAAGQEAMQLSRELAKDHPAAFTKRLAVALVNLPDSLSALGHPEEALAARQQTIQLCQELAKDRPAAFNEALAASLTNLSVSLSVLGHPEDALAAGQEAMQVYRELAKDHPEAFTKGLAVALSNISGHLSSLRRHEDALAATQEAIQLYRELAKDRSAVFIESLTAALINLSRSLSALGRREDALAAGQEAIQLSRELAKDRPAAFTKSLAAALTNILHCLSAVSRPEDALTAGQEAIQLYRELAKDHPAAFAEGLAAALLNFSPSLSALGLHKDALTAGQEATQVYRELVRGHPIVFTESLAASLTNLSRCLSALGLHEDALAVGQEAIQVYRELTRDHPAAFVEGFAIALGYLSVSLSALGRLEDALAARQESIQVYRELGKLRPATFTKGLAAALLNLSRSLSALGRHEDALAAGQEAIQVYRELAKDRPAAFTGNLISTLINLSRSLLALSRPEDALAAIKEALKLHRELVKGHPTGYTPDLANTLNNLSLGLSGLGRHGDALATMQEAMMLYRELARDRPAFFTPSLANGLDSLSTCLSGLGRREDALTAIQEAIKLYRELANDQTTAFTPGLAESLRHLSTILSGLDSPIDALNAIQEATELYRQLAADRPAVFTEDLASSLDLLLESLTRLGQHDDARAVRQEADKLRQEITARAV